MLRSTVQLLVFLTISSFSEAWMIPQSSRSSKTSLKATRQEFVKAIGASIVGSALLTATPAAFADDVSLANGVTYKVVKKGKDADLKPEIGDLVAIRFAAYAGDNKIDDIFDTPEPYYTRLGSGGLLKGVEETLPLMNVGDRWVLTIPSKLAFGNKGRPASAGKPRIPGDAVIIFDVEMVGLPGKETELIELIGD